MTRNIRLGTRGSRLALKQADIVAKHVTHLDPSLEIEVVVIATTGDKDKKTSLSELGGKGVFIKEVEHSLVTKDIDIAVHSFKDVTTDLATGCDLVGFLPPESQSDVMVYRAGLEPRDGMKIGTGSLRRKALLKHHFDYDVTILDIRGNVDTRLRKLDSGELDGLLLSEAGLIRLGLEDRVSTQLPVKVFYPAPGQGVIALECREEDADFCALCRQITPPEQYIKSSTQFDVLAQIGFDCRDPLGLLVSLHNDRITLSGFVASQDLNHFFEYRCEGDVAKRADVISEWVNVMAERRDSW